MADIDKKEPPGTAPSTPSSQREGTVGSNPGKDSQCPFCGQAFTSSSLGRHLDLYIKPRNPKPPDGVHDVDEIKKLRGSITRRQPKMSLKPGANVNVSGWREDSTGSTPNTRSVSRPASKVETRITEGSPVTSPMNFRDGDKVQTSFNAPNWQATGVINNLPPRVPSRNNTATPTGQAQRLDAMRRNAVGNKIQRPEYESESTSKLHEDAEVGRAAQLALREVLGSLEAAKRRIEPEQQFDGVDFFSLTFPGLCLAILPAPSTLFSPSPFPGADTWSLVPPGQKQFNALKRHLNVIIRERGNTQRLSDSLSFKHAAHASGAYEHWQMMSEPEKATAWNLEVCRAFARAQEQKQQGRQDLEVANNRIRHLEAEYDRLSRCQLPREHLLHPPSTIPAPIAIMKELNNNRHSTAAAEASYDADALLSKWRTTVRATTRRPPMATSQNSNAASSYPPRSSESQLHGDMVLNGAIIGVNGAMPRPTYPVHAHDPAVDYEIPPNLGAIVGAEDEEDAVDADADGEAEEAEAGSFHSYASRGALVRQKRVGVDCEQSPGVQIQPWALNANGKRRHAPTPLSGRAGGPKVYKERWSDREKGSREV